MSYPLSKCYFPAEVERIMQIAFQHGITASVLEAETAWQEASDDACASWLGTDSYTDLEIWLRLPTWFTEVEERE